MAEENFGFKNEEVMLPIIQSFFNDSTIYKLTNKYSLFDYRGADALYELKTRKCKRLTYTTTIFPTNKFKFEPNTKKILVFSFEDGNYYIEYNEAFNTFKKEVKKFRHDRGGQDKAVEYIHIPVERLLPLEDKFSYERAEPEPKKRDA